MQNYFLLHFKKAKWTSATLLKVPERLELHPLYKQFLEDLEVSKHDGGQGIKLEAKDVLSFSMKHDISGFLSIGWTTHSILE